MNYGWWRQWARNKPTSPGSKSAGHWTSDAREKSERGGRGVSSILCLPHCDRDTCFRVTIFHYTFFFLSSATFCILSLPDENVIWRGRVLRGGDLSAHWEFYWGSHFHFMCSYEIKQIYIFDNLDLINNTSFQYQYQLNLNSKQLKCEPAVLMSNQIPLFGWTPIAIKKPNNAQLYTTL